jgi:mannosyltransferase
VPTRVAVVALTVLGGVLRFATLDRQSFWLDELVTVRLLRRGFSAMLGEIPTSEATPYVYYVVGWAWTHVFGFGEVGLRSLSALAGTATIPVAYAAGAALVSRRSGLIAAALVAVNPFLVWYSQEARAYALFAFFSAVSLMFFARRSALPWAVASALAIATHYFAIFLVAPMAIWRRWLVPALIPAVVLAAHIPLLLDQRHSGQSVAQSALRSRIAGIPKDLVVGYSFPAELAGSLLAGALVVVGLVLLFTCSKSRGAYVAGTLAAVAVVVPIVLAVGGADYVIARNMIAAVVPAAVCLGAGYAVGRLGLGAGAALCCLSLAIVVSVAADPQYGRTDWRGAAHRLGVVTHARAVVVTPDIDAELWDEYLSGLQDASEAPVREIDVVGLATQGGFSTGAVKPPEGPPKPPPPGFRLTDVERHKTFTFVRYQATNGHEAPVSPSQLAALRLASDSPGLFLQRRR